MKRTVVKIEGTFRKETAERYAFTELNVTREKRRNDQDFLAAYKKTETSKEKSYTIEDNYSLEQMEKFEDELKLCISSIKNDYFNLDVTYINGKTLPLRNALAEVKHYHSKGKSVSISPLTFVIKVRYREELLKDDSLKDLYPERYIEANTYYYSKESCIEVHLPVIPGFTEKNYLEYLEIVETAIRSNGFSYKEHFIGIKKYAAARLGEDKAKEADKSFRNDKGSDFMKSATESIKQTDADIVSSADSLKKLAELKEKRKSDINLTEALAFTRTEGVSNSESS